MLGRLRMTIDETISQYRDLCREAFTRMDTLRLAKRKSRTAALEKALRRVIGQDWETKPLNDGWEGPGKVYETPANVISAGFVELMTPLASL